MGESLIDPLIMELNAQMKDDRITREHLKVFLEKPDRVFDSKESSKLFFQEGEDLVLLSVSDGHIQVACIAEGKPLFVAKRGEKYVVVWGKEEFEEYDYIAALSFAKGRPLYYARRGEEGMILWGKEQVASVGFCSPDVLGMANGQPYYLRGPWCAPVWGQEEYGTGRRRFDEFSVVDGKPLFITGPYGEHRVIWGSEESRSYHRVSCLSVVDGKLLYAVGQPGARRGGPESWRMVWGDREFGDYNGIQSLDIVDGKFLAVARRSRQWLIVWGDEEFEVHGNISNVQIIDGKPLHVAPRAGKKCLIWNGYESKLYDRIVQVETTPESITAYVLKYVGKNECRLLKTYIAR